MKRGFRIGIVAALALLMAGCGGSDKKEEAPRYDGWMLTRWNGGTELSGKVFLQLNEDMTFALYQCIDTPGYRKLTGTYVKEGQVLSGHYSDGTPWESSYAIEKQTETELQLRSETDDVVSLYTAVEVPAYAKGRRRGPLRVRASGSGEAVPLTRAAGHNAKRILHRRIRFLRRRRGRVTAGL